MRVPGTYDFNVRSGLKALAASARRCEKVSPSSALEHQGSDLNDDGERSGASLQIELVCQEETKDFDPFWDGPRLLPTFVAQLMGQVIWERRDPAISVETAYGSARSPRKALLLDRKS
ncbi:MAG TPA: hypothetical protein VJ750_12300 [Rhizomicrobium sp.]|nr:hypothetical protein [Rhizomicrobium sp.]